MTPLHPHSSGHAFPKNPDQNRAVGCALNVQTLDLHQLSRVWGRGGLQASSCSQCQSEARQPESCTDPKAQRGDLQPGARPSLGEHLPSSFGRIGQGGTGQQHPTAEGEEKAQHCPSILMLSRSQMTQQKCSQHHSPGQGGLGLPSVTQGSSVPAEGVGSLWGAQVCPGCPILHLTLALLQKALLQNTAHGAGHT